MEGAQPLPPVATWHSSSNDLFGLLVLIIVLVLFQVPLVLQLGLLQVNLIY